MEHRLPVRAGARNDAPRQAGWDPINPRLAALIGAGLLPQSLDLLLVLALLRGGAANNGGR
jgi:hypothetical protein